MMIELSPSLALKTEVLAGDPCECPMCGGSGVGDMKPTDDGFAVTEDPCPGCAGTGEVFAVVTVEWRPVKE